MRTMTGLTRPMSTPKNCTDGATAPDRQELAHGGIEALR